MTALNHESIRVLTDIVPGSLETQLAAIVSPLAHAIEMVIREDVTKSNEYKMKLSQELCTISPLDVASPNFVYLFALIWILL